MWILIIISNVLKNCFFVFKLLMCFALYRLYCFWLFCFSVASVEFDNTRLYHDEFQQNIKTQFFYYATKIFFWLIQTLFCFFRFSTFLAHEKYTLFYFCVFAFFLNLLRQITPRFTDSLSPLLHRVCEFTFKTFTKKRGFRFSHIVSSPHKSDTEKIWNFFCLFVWTWNSSFF